MFKNFSTSISFLKQLKSQVGLNKCACVEMKYRLPI